MIIPQKNPSEQLNNESLFLPCAIITAGEIRLKKDAAHITPAAILSRADKKLPFLLFLKKNTNELPKTVPKKGYSKPFITVSNRISPPEKEVLFYNIAISGFVEQIKNAVRKLTAIFYSYKAISFFAIL